MAFAIYMRRRLHTTAFWEESLMKLKEKYIYDEGSDKITICYEPNRKQDNNTAIKDFCYDYGIRLEDFNISVIIGENVTNCSHLLTGCKNFNQPVMMHDRIINTWEMFSGCEKFNQPIILPDSIKICEAMFRDCKSFNQKITLPAKVVKTTGMFVGCESFNQPIDLPENLTISIGMFKLCKKFNQKITLPDNLECCDGMFVGCSDFNQSVTLGKNIERCWDLFHDCISLNQPIEILNADCICNNMFQNCSALQPEMVTVHLRKTSNKNIEKRLQKMWGMEEVKSNVQVVLESLPPKKKVSSIKYCLTSNKKYEIKKQELQTATVDELNAKFVGFYNNQELSSLEMTMETEECSKTLVVYFENKKFCISIIDENTDKIYYYDSGEGDDSIEIAGNIYPRHMISENVDIMGDFMQKGRPSKKVQWIAEKI